MAASLVIRNVTVIDGNGGAPVAGVDVVVRDGRFAAIGPGVGAREAMHGGVSVDGAGRFLIPGLWEAHTHLRSALRGSDEERQAIVDETLRAYLRRGITSVVDLGGPLAVFLRVRERQRRTGPAGGARLWFSGPSFTGINGWPFTLHHDPTCVHQVQDEAPALAAMRAQLAQRPDVVKLMYDGQPGAPDKLPRPVLEALIREAHAHGVRALVHVRSARDSLDAVEAGADGLEHSFVPGPGQMAAEAEQVTAALVRGAAYLTPTLTIWEQLARAGDRAYLAELAAEGLVAQADVDALTAPTSHWGQAEFPHHPKAECQTRLQAALQMLPAMQAAGVRLVTGSDVAIALSRPAAALREIALLARAGVPAGDVLMAATRHAAEKIGVGATIGTIEPGKLADALLLDANPLQSIDVLVRPGHLVATIQDGHLHAAANGPAAVS